MDSSLIYSLIFVGINFRWFSLTNSKQKQKPILWLGYDNDIETLYFKMVKSMQNIIDVTRFYYYFFKKVLLLVYLFYKSVRSFITVIFIKKLFLINCHFQSSM